MEAKTYDHNNNLKQN